MSGRGVCVACERDGGCLWCVCVCLREMGVFVVCVYVCVFEIDGGVCGVCVACERDWGVCGVCGRGMCVGRGGGCTCMRQRRVWK